MKKTIAEIRYAIAKLEDPPLQIELTKLFEKLLRQNILQSHRGTPNVYLNRIRLLEAKLDRMTNSNQELTVLNKDLKAENEKLKQRTSSYQPTRNLLLERKKNAILAYQIESMTRSSGEQSKKITQKRSRLFDW